MARIRAAANMKRSYGMELERSGTQAQLTMRDRILLAAQQQTPGSPQQQSERLPRPASGQVSNPIKAAAEIEVVPEPGWSKKLDSQHMKKQRLSGNDQTASPRGQNLRQPKAAGMLNLSAI